MTYHKKDLILDQDLIIQDINLKQMKVQVLLHMTILDIQKILMTEKVIVSERKSKI